MDLALANRILRLPVELRADLADARIAGLGHLSERLVVDVA